MAFLGNLTVRLDGNTTQFTRNMVTAERTITRFGNKAEIAGRKVQATGRHMKQLGGRMTMGVTAPIVGLGIAAVKTFSNFDLAMTRSLAIMGDVSATMKGEMIAAADEMSIKYNIAATDIAKSFFFLASAGLDAKQSLAALPAVMDFAKAGAFDLATATTLLIGSQSALGLKVKDPIKNLTNMVMISDKLVKANTLADASTQQFAEALGSEAAAASKNFGISLDETIAALAGYAEQMIKGAPAGSLFSRMIRLLARGVSENREEFEKLGVAVVDENDRFRNMADIAGDLGDKLRDMGVTQKALTLKTLGFQARVQQAIFPLLNMRDAMNKYQDAMKNAGGITKEVADKQLKAFHERLGSIWRRIQKVGRTIGRDLVPIVEKLAKMLERAAIAFEKMTPKEREKTLKRFAMAAAAGPLLQAGGNAALIGGAGMMGVGKLSKMFRRPAAMIGAGAQGMSGAAAGGNMAGGAAALAAARKARLLGGTRTFSNAAVMQGALSGKMKSDGMRFGPMIIGAKTAKTGITGVNVGLVKSLSLLGKIAKIGAWTAVALEVAAVAIESRKLWKQIDREREIQANGQWQAEQRQKKYGTQNVGTIRGVRAAAAAGDEGLLDKYAKRFPEMVAVARAQMAKNEVLSKPPEKMPRDWKETFSEGLKKTEKKVSPETKSFYEALENRMDSIKGEMTDDKIDRLLNEKGLGADQTREQMLKRATAGAALNKGSVAAVTEEMKHKFGGVANKEAQKERVQKDQLKVLQEVRDALGIVADNTGELSIVEDEIGT